MVTSSSINIALYEHHSLYFYSIRQSCFIIISIFAFLLILLIPTNYYKNNYIIFFFIILILLFIVLIPGIGKNINGARRWISLIIINIQVAELSKLLVIIFFSGYINKNLEKMNNFKEGILKPIVMLTFILILLLIEPDFGSTVIILICILSMLFISGNKLRWYALLLVILIILLLLLILTSPYRIYRIIGFLHPWKNINTSSYQLIQALVCFSRGGWFGNGLGNSVQKQFFLPEAYTDFITSIIVEELGLISLIILIFIYLFLILRGMNIAKISFKLKRYYQSFLAYGISISLNLQVFINIGVNIGLLPTKGITLPFISYGGSSLLTTSCMLAILLKIDFENKFFIIN